MSSAAILLVLVLGACGGRSKAGPHWPKSAGAITPEDPAEDGGESLEPHRISEQAAAVEHGGDDQVTSVLDEPAPSSPAPASGGSSDAPPPTIDITPEGIPVFEETIIVN